MTDVGNFLIYGAAPVLQQIYKDTMVSPRNTKVRGYGEVRILHVPPLKWDVG